MSQLAFQIVQVKEPWNLIGPEVSRIRYFSDMCLLQKVRRLLVLSYSAHKWIRFLPKAPYFKNLIFGTFWALLTQQDFFRKKSYNSLTSCKKAENLRSHFSDFPLQMDERMNRTKFIKALLLARKPNKEISSNVKPSNADLRNEWL